MTEEEVLNPILIERQNATYRDMIDKLLSCGLVNVVRPTGFGKTQLVRRMCEVLGDKKFLYIWDTTYNRDNFESKYFGDNVYYLSYSKLCCSGDTYLLQECKLQDIWCVIFDESHLMGGKNVELNLENLNGSGIRMLGCSANEGREDEKDNWSQLLQCNWVKGG